MGDSWEERMAAKASAREQAMRDEAAEARALWWQEQHDKYVSDYAATLTKETAEEEQRIEEENPVGCACVGGPLCCHVRYEARQRILNQ